MWGVSALNALGGIRKMISKVELDRGFSLHSTDCGECVWGGEVTSGIVVPIGIAVGVNGETAWGKGCALLGRIVCVEGFGGGGRIGGCPEARDKGGCVSGEQRKVGVLNRRLVDNGPETSNDTEGSSEGLLGRSC